MTVPLFWDDAHCVFGPIALHKFNLTIAYYGILHQHSVLYVLVHGFMCTISIQLKFSKFKIMFFFIMGISFRLICTYRVPVAVDVWAICYILLGCFMMGKCRLVWGYRPIAFDRI